MKTPVKMVFLAILAVMICSCGKKNDVKPPVKASIASFSALNP